jgi:hypothetical protein
MGGYITAKDEICMKDLNIKTVISVLKGFTFDYSKELNILHKVYPVDDFEK